MGRRARRGWSGTGQAASGFWPAHYLSAQRPGPPPGAPSWSEGSIWPPPARGAATGRPWPAWATALQNPAPQHAPRPLPHPRRARQFGPGPPGPLPRRSQGVRTVQGPWEAGPGRHGGGGAAAMAPAVPSRPFSYLLYVFIPFYTFLYRFIFLHSLFPGSIRLPSRFPWFSLAQAAQPGCASQAPRWHRWLRRDVPGAALAPPASALCGWGGGGGCRTLPVPPCRDARCWGVHGFLVFAMRWVRRPPLAGRAPLAAWANARDVVSIYIFPVGLRAAGTGAFSFVPPSFM